MSSSALNDWRSVGLARLDELEAVHVQATGTARGRRWGTTQLNRSLFVMLVAQFQSYCRELHDQSVDVHVAVAVDSQKTILRALLTQSRQLDKRNPRTSALGSDFGRLGFSLINDLKVANSAAATDLEALEELIDYRNAIGHGDEASIASIEAGARLRATKSSYRNHRHRTDRLARTMDHVVAGGLAALLGISQPW